MVNALTENNYYLSAQQEKLQFYITFQVYIFLRNYTILS
ncbi:hypothetical protein CSB69_4337 [Morganella morganii]|nr:hypothetical protein CSB69_4337 [Morganella morganii]EMP51447.1 hypothetical protein C790_01162 [Morganella morganii SC01]